MIKNLSHGFLPIWDISADPNCTRLASSLEIFAEADANLVVLRSRGLDEARYTELFTEAVHMADQLGLTLISHKHWQLAKALPQIGGVHLTADSDSVELVRDTLGEDILIGYSAHTLAEAQDAVLQGADYILFGPIFPTVKNGIAIPGVGIPALAKICHDIPAPIYAIGGITEENLILTKDAGAHGFAALRAVFKTETDDELAHAVQKLTLLWNT